MLLSSFFLLEPNAPPADLQGYNGSSTSIFVQWGEVPAADQNGVIEKYTVTYKALPDDSPQTEEVSAPTTEITLTDLNEYTNYSITVFASTVKGAGNESKPIIVITDEDSKYYDSLRATSHKYRPIDNNLKQTYFLLVNCIDFRKFAFY